MGGASQESLALGSRREKNIVTRQGPLKSLALGSRRGTGQGPPLKRLALGTVLVVESKAKLTAL